MKIDSADFKTQMTFNKRILYQNNSFVFLGYDFSIYFQFHSHFHISFVREKFVEMWNFYCVCVCVLVFVVVAGCSSKRKYSSHSAIVMRFHVERNEKFSVLDGWELIKNACWVLHAKRKESWRKWMFKMYLNWKQMSWIAFHCEYSCARFIRGLQCIEHVSYVFFYYCILFMSDALVIYNRASLWARFYWFKFCVKNVCSI